MPQESARTITAIVDSPNQARAAAAGLQQEGFPREAITVMSGEPLPGFIADSESTSPPARAGLLAIAGGLVGAAAAIGLTVWTSRRMGLVTGGMPIVTTWAFGIIVYELTALGAILAVFVTTVYEAGLLRKAPPPEIDSAIADGKVAVAVSCPTETSMRTAEIILAKFGADINGAAIPKT